MAGTIIFQKTEMGRARQLLHYLTPTLGLTRIGNRLAERKVSVVVERDALVVDGERMGDSWHNKYLAGRLYRHGVAGFTLDDVNKYDLKAAFRSIIHRSILIWDEDPNHRDRRPKVLPTAIKLGVFGIGMELYRFGGISFSPEEEEIIVSASLPRATLLALAREGSSKAYDRLKDSLTPHELEFLSSSWKRCKDIASHPLTPRSTLFKLVGDTDSEIAMIAYDRIKDTLTPDEAKTLVTSSHKKIKLSILPKVTDSSAARILAGWPDDLLEGGEVVSIGPVESCCGGSTEGTITTPEVRGYFDSTVDRLIQAIKSLHPQRQTAILELLKPQNGELHARIMDRWDK